MKTKKEILDINKAMERLRRLKIDSLFDDSLVDELEELQKQIDYFEYGIE